MNKYATLIECILAVLACIAAIAFAQAGQFPAAAWALTAAIFQLRHIALMRLKR